jgi:hypothetical protein
MCVHLSHVLLAVTCLHSKLKIGNLDASVIASVYQLNEPKSVFYNARYHVSHPYKTTDKIRVLHILMFRFLVSRREQKTA